MDQLRHILKFIEKACANWRTLFAHFKDMQLLIRQWQPHTLLELDYSPNSQDPFMSYLLVRSRIVLGRPEEAETMLQAWERAIPQAVSLTAHSLREILWVQIECLRGMPSLSHTDRLNAFNFSEVGDSFLRTYGNSERLSTLGYSHFQACRYADAIHPYDSATALQRPIELNKQEGIVTFNLFTACTHISQWSRAEKHLARMRELVEACNDQTLAGYLARMEAYQYLHSSEFELARARFLDSNRHFKEVARFQDVRINLSYLAFLSLCDLDYAKFDAAAFAITQVLDPAHYLCKRITAFRVIREHPLVTLRDSQTIIQSQIESGLDGNSILAIYFLLAKALTRAKDYDGVIAIFEQYRQSSTQLEQSVDLLDFRPLAIEAYIASGNRTKGASLLAQFEYDAYQRNSRVRSSEAIEIRNRFNLLAKNASLTKNPARIAFTLDLNSRKLLLDSKTIDLSAHPLIVTFLRILLDHPHGVSYERTFEICYGVEFNPDLHQSRFNSLISRTRKLLGSSSYILWAGGYLSLSPDLDPMIEEAAGSECAS